MSFGVSQKEDKFTGLWKTAQVGELLRLIFTSVPDLHSVSSQSQQREKKESWGYGDSRERRRKAGAMETAEREEGKLGLWRQHGNAVAKISLVYEISLQAL